MTGQIACHIKTERRPCKTRIQRARTRSPVTVLRAESITSPLPCLLGQKEEKT